MYTGILVYTYTGILVYTYTGIHVYWYTHILVYTYTGIHIYWYTGILVYTYTGIHVLENILVYIVGCYNWFGEEEKLKFVFWVENVSSPPTLPRHPN